MILHAANELSNNKSATGVLVSHCFAQTTILNSKVTKLSTDMEKIRIQIRDSSDKSETLFSSIAKKLDFLIEGGGLQIALLPN